MKTLWLLYGAATPLTLLLLLRLARPSESAIRTLARALADAVRRRGGRAVLALMVAVLVGNFVQSAADDSVTEWLGYDLTARIWALEGDFVERFQRGLPRSLELLLAWVYVPGYVAFLLFGAVAFARAGDAAGLAGYMLAFVANYVLALPFYLGFPVQEVAWSGLVDARPLVESVWPDLTAALRAGSALDNCFPSLHVSCTTSALWFLVRRAGLGERTVGWIVWTLTAWSVMALAIHWALDVLAGLFFGALCAACGELLARPALAWLDARRQRAA